MERDPLRGAFDRFREHEPYIRRIVLGIVRDPARADDVIQETYVVALSSGRAARDPRQWLARVARNFALLSRRRDARRARNERLGARHDATGPVDEALADFEARRRVFRAMRRLTAIDRHMLTLRYAEKTNFLDIGARVGLSAEAARSRIRRALQTLREALSDAYESTTPWWRADLLPGFESPDPRAFAR
ncbi:MAG TPA: sigma-70 family RNA polymerase sigma factor [Planctomycetota bacterium]|nr:sigma-70 family RNA polymerase sigma factor [Planctomycetota bacterium]